MDIRPDQVGRGERNGKTGKSSGVDERRQSRGKCESVETCEKRVIRLEYGNWRWNRSKDAICWSPVETTI